MSAFPSSMRAAWIPERGAAQAIRVGTLAVPAIGPTDVLVRVEYVAVNPIDTHVRAGRYFTPLPFPFILGRDCVGTVAALGAGVTQFQPGDRVWSNSLGHAGRQGCTAEYAAVAADRLYALPAGSDPQTAVAVLHPGASAFMAIATQAQTCAGETVFIAGGAGNVGGAAIVLARQAGARVIASASATDLDYCRALGADTVFDYRDPALAAQIRRAAPEGLDVHLDTSGKHDLETAIDLLAPRGRLVLMAGLAARPVFPVGALYTRDARVLGFAISNASAASLQLAAARVNQLLSSHALVPRRVEVLPLEEVANAHRRLEEGNAAGSRLVIKL